MIQNSYDVICITDVDRVCPDEKSLSLTWLWVTLTGVQYCVFYFKASTGS